MTDDEAASLDWSRHLLPPERAEHGPGIFLADYAQTLAAAIHEGWSGREPRWIRPPDGPEPDLPEPKVAFDASRRPVASVHERDGPMVRRVLSPAAWASIKLRIRDREAWERSFRRDPADGSYVPSGVLRSRGGKDARDPITWANWQAAWDFATVDRLSRLHALRAMARVATGVATMARDGRIELLARPIRGGVAVPAPTWIWDCGWERRMRIIAACGVNLDDDDPSADPVTHLLFVAGDDPDGAAREYGDEHYVPEYPELGRLVWPDNMVEDESEADDPPDSMDQTGATSVGPSREQAIADFLWTAMRSFGGDNWRQQDLLTLVDARFGLEFDEIEEADDIVKLVRADLLAHEEGGERRFAFLSRSGQPPKSGRPSMMERKELEALIRSIDAKVDSITRTA